ncbi:MAG: hypothetical protein JRJ49_01865 [Deltaproteobacteria bacterium]|nr:hypothetical protein [Deltaproteobacteria bacterium]
MNIFEITKDINNLYLFIIFAIPGFISIKTYNTLSPSDKKNAPQVIIDAITYSCLNYALMSWAIYLDLYFNLSVNYPLLHILTLLTVVFISPIILSFAYYKLRESKTILKIAPHPTLKSWDYIFGKKEVYWIILELQDGKRIGGIYDKNSFASSFPAEEQIYIEELWEIEGKKFIKPIERSKGVMVNGNNIKFIEYYT